MNIFHFKLSLKQNYFTWCCLFIFLINQTYSQVPVIRWDKTIGGINDDNGYSIVSLPDGGFVVTGNSSSLPGGNKTAPSMGGWDYWVIRLDSTGKLIWDKSYGGIKDDGFQVTSGIFLPQDKGLLLGGFSNSNPGGNKISPLKSINDIWLIRLDSVGNKVWEKSFGGSNYPSSSTNYLKFLQLKDGNILIGSNITGSGGDISQPSFGYYDYWIIKIDMNANKIWDKRFGGNRDDYLSDVLELKNGDLLLGGYSYSDAGGAKTNPNQGGVGSVYGDYWVVKTDSTGKKIWDRTYGGTQGDYLSSMCKVSDYSILLAGQSSSGIGGNKTSPNYSGVDYWVIKIDTSGGKIFEKTFNYSNGDNLMTIAPLYNKSYLLSGFTHSLSLNDWEFYIINIDSLGNKNWEKIVGGSGEEILKGAIASPNGFVLTGSSTSQTGKDKSENSFGKNDAWVVKFCIPPVSRITVNGDSVLCLGNSTMLEAPQGNYIYSWSNGAKTPSISVKDSGSYFVIVSDSSGCSAKSTPVKIKVQIPAQIIASGPLTFCAGGSVNLTASQGFSYTWSTGAQTNSIKVTSPGSYVVTVASACGILSAGPVSVIVNPLPGASISPSGNVYTCYNNLPLLAAGGGVSYVWSTGETTSSITANDDISYYVIAKDNNGCTKQSSFTNIYFDYPAFFTITNGDTVNCNGESIYLSPNPGATSYSWNTGSNIPVLSVTQSGTYQVTISNQCGTTTSLPRKITFYPYPLTSITGNHRACSGSPIQLSAHGAMTYKWSSGISSSDSVISDIPVLDKKYIVQGSNGPCSRNDTFLVKVDSLPLADFTYTVYGAKVTFGNISKASEKFKWFFGDGNTSVQKNPVHFYASDSIRTYTVSLIVYSDSCGSDTISYIFKAGLGEVSTFSGRGLSGTLEGPPNIAGFCIPMRIAYYPRSKKIFLIESAGFCGMFGSTYNLIRQIDSIGNATMYYSTYPYDKTLSAIAVNKKGAVFVASGNAIYYVDTVKKNLIVFAQGADFDFISGLSFDQYDNLYVCDQSRREIKMVDSSGQVSWIAGFASQYGHSDGFVYNATFKYPIDLFMDTLQDCIYIADDQMIRKIDLNSSWVSTLAGDTIIGYADGKGKAARFRNITSICADKNNNIFTAELGQVIRRVSNDSNVVTRAGTTVQGYKDGPASTAQFNAPYGICIDETGNLFVSEAGNDVLRKIRAQKNIISSISSYSILTAKKRISVYPNPFGETSTVDLSEIKKSVNDNLSFHLFSVLGKEVMIRSNISGNKLLIEKKDMAVGIYLYKVVLNEKCIEDGKLIIQ